MKYRQAIIIPVMAIILAGCGSAATVASSEPVVLKEIPRQEVTEMDFVKEMQLLKAMVVEDNIAEEEVEVIESVKGDLLGEFQLTGYCSCVKCCGKYAKNRPRDAEGLEIVIGAAGNRLFDGVSIAVDPEIIPLGTEVYIEGYGVRVAQDTGVAVKGKIIDIYHTDHARAYSVGRQKGIKVYTVIKK